MDLHESIQSLMKAFLDPGSEGLDRVELGGVQRQEDRLDVQRLQQLEGERGLVGAMVVYVFIDGFVSGQRGFVPDLFEKQSHGHLGGGLVQLVDKAPGHAVADAAKHGDP